MTMRGLVLGNSHTACLREAWRVTGSEEAFTLGFLAAHKELMSGLQFADGRADAGTPELRKTLARLGMATGFELTDYDFFVVTACQVSMFRAAGAARQMTVWPHQGGSQTLVSNPAFVSALADDLRTTTAWQIIEGLLETDAPILLLPQPHPHESVLNADTRFPGFRNAVHGGRADWLAGRFRAACDVAVAGKARVLHQPLKTVSNHICTADSYQAGSIRLSSGHHEHEASDILHANVQYGTLQLAQIRDALEATQ